MAGKRIPEGTVNYVLGEILLAKNSRWQGCIDTEMTGVLEDAKRKRPDLVVNHYGNVPVAIESEYEPANTVEVDALSRLGKRLSDDGREIEQVIALKFPRSVGDTKPEDLKKVLLETTFKYVLYRGTRKEWSCWPVKGFIEGGIDDFVSFVEQTALSEKIMDDGMELLEKSIRAASNIVQKSKSTAVDTHRALAEILQQEEGEQTTRMAMAILANAVSFHNAIANQHGIKPLMDLRNQIRLGQEWKRILEEINYWPIFHIARRILGVLQVKVANRIIDSLIESAAELEDIGATSQHDLSGRMLQRLISDRKFLATFYTLPESAALLAELAISRLNTDWSSKEEVTKLQIGDFACGTGALLNAAYSSILSRYRRAGNDDAEIHAPMMEQALVGTDIMPAATHLTASMLSSAHPGKKYLNTRIITLPYGKNGDNIDLGALDLIDGQTAFSLFQTSRQSIKAKEDGEDRVVDIPHNSFDLVIMNPPFTRSMGQEGDKKGTAVPAFAGLGNNEDEQRLMGKMLNSLMGKNTAGHGHAGLASHFIDIASIKVKKGGTIAIVIPFTFTSGNAWAKARDHLERFYHDIMVVSIASAGHKDRAFSADTGMAEVQIIATRSYQENISPHDVMYVNLTHRPSSVVEASILARAISEGDGVIQIGKECVGCILRSNGGFAPYAGIVDMELVNSARRMRRGQLLTPRMYELIDIPLVNLGELGNDMVTTAVIKHIHMRYEQSERGAFDIVPIESIKSASYPILWAHDHKRETRLVLDPDSQGIKARGRESRAEQIWLQYAGRLCFNQDFRLSSQPLAACLTSVKALGGRAWPGFVAYDESHEISILLFANSTLGLISHWWNGSRQQHGRAIQTVRKFAEMTTIDPRGFTDEQFAIADDIFERIKDKEFLPANEAYRDDTRKELDRAVLIELLGLDESIMESIDLLRYKWCCEPSVHGGKSTRPK